MPNITRHDPLRGFKFRVNIGAGDIGFSKVGGLKEETETTEYREGHDPSTPRKLPGLTTYDDVTLERGVGTNDALVRWRRQVINIQTSGRNAPDGVVNFRRDVIITAYNKQGQKVKTWKLLNAWPKTLEYSDLDAASSDVVIEKLVLAHEGLVHGKGLPGFVGQLAARALGALQGALGF